MTSASEPFGDTAAAVIMKPYAGDPDTRERRRLRRWILTIVTGFCLFQGLAFAFLAPFMMVAFAVPEAILFLLVVWALPGLKAAPTRTMEWLFYAGLITGVAWPNYLCLALPGIPWITMSRLIGIPLALTLLVCVSTSAEVRARLSAVMGSAPRLWRLLAVFVLIQFISIGFSSQPFFSLDKFVTAQTGWTAMMVIGAYVFLTPGQVTRWAAILWAMAMFAAAIGFYELIFRHLPWYNHIPSFLGDDASVVSITTPHYRRYTNILRIQGTFSGPMQFAEFLALTMPFVLHFAVEPYRPWTRGLAAGSIPVLLFVTLETNSRSGAGGVLAGMFLYALFWAAMRWRRNPGSLFAMRMLMAYPAAAAIGGVAVLFVGRLHRIFLGGAETAASGDARSQQWHLGLPKVISHPWGYGIGRGADTVGWYTPGGFLSIDTYYLSVLVEYGVIGFILYFGMFLIFYLHMRVGRRTTNPRPIPKPHS